MRGRAPTTRWTGAAGANAQGGKGERAKGKDFAPPGQLRRWAASLDIMKKITPAKLSQFGHFYRSGAQALDRIAPLCFQNFAT